MPAFSKLSDLAGMEFTNHGDVLLGERRHLKGLNFNCGYSVVLKNPENFLNFLEWPLFVS